MGLTETLSLAEARRIALVAQGFRDPRHTPPTMRTLSRTVARTGVLQVDSVNVLQRAHYMPLFSRMGAYDADLLRRASAASPRRLVEYWAHVQALMPVELWPLMRHRMQWYAERQGKWWPIVAERRGIAEEVLAAVRERGPVSARDLEREFDQGPRTKEHWGWNWSQARRVLDYLYMVGEVAIAGRTAQFEPQYDVPDRVLPAEILRAPVPTPEEAKRALIEKAARSHGIGSVQCLADYYRMSIADARVAVQELVEEGTLRRVEVRGWARPTYLHAEAARPRHLRARALLSPFDPVVWERARAEALFDFHYRIEIYTPAAQRVHGYYVLPFLLDDQIVARVDLKADRKRRCLQVPSAFAESTASKATAAALASALAELAHWLGLETIQVGTRGDLADDLRHAVAGSAR